MLINIKKKEKKEIPKKVRNNGFAKMDALTKLRLIVGSIFALSTLSIILVFANLWTLGAFLISISYVLVFALMVKLLLTKKL